MRLRVIPALAAVTKPAPSEVGCCQTKARGLAVLHSPMLNKGTAFTDSERKALGLTGLLPPEISTLATQVERASLPTPGSILAEITDGKHGGPAHDAAAPERMKATRSLRSRSLSCSGIIRGERLGRSMPPFS